MIDVFEIDVSGSDIFERYYSMAVIYNNHKKYGFRFNKKLQNSITRNNQQGKYCVDNPKSLKPRVYSAILILLLKKITEKEKIGKEYKLLICEDLYGHFNQIGDLLIQNLQKEFPGLDKKKHILKCRHQKDSLVQKTAHDIYKGRFEETTLCDFKLSEIEDVLSKCRIRL